MTISSIANRKEYTGNSATLDFAFPYKFLANADLKVYLDGTLQTITTHYTVVGAGLDGGGTVSFLVAPAAGKSVVILRDPVATQELDLVENDPLPAESVENALDKQTTLIQRLIDRVDRSLVVADTDVSGADFTVPTPVANGVIAFNDTADALEVLQVADLGAITLPIPVASGGTGATTADDALTSLGGTTAGKAVFKAATVAAAQQAIDVEVGVDVQAYDADIATVAASQGEMEAGTEAELRSMSPLRVAQAIAALGGGGGVRVRTLLSGTTYTVPSDVQSIFVMVVGATGGIPATANRGGCGGAGYSEKYYATPAASYAYTIGAAGAVTPTAGGTTTFDTISITGGSSPTNTTGAAGGVASGGDFNANGGAGGNTSTNEGGGGGAGSRAGNGYAGGAGGATAAGGGGGTGGAGGANNAVQGIAATAISGSATVIAGYTDVRTPPLFSAGISGYGAPTGDLLCVLDGSWTNQVQQYILSTSANSGNNSTAGVARVGTQGQIQIWEFL